MVILSKSVAMKHYFCLNFKIGIQEIKNLFLMSSDFQSVKKRCNLETNKIVLFHLLKKRYIILFDFIVLNKSKKPGTLAFKVEDIIF